MGMRGVDDLRNIRPDGLKKASKALFGIKVGPPTHDPLNMWAELKW
jgi:hypothetical protein